MAREIVDQALYRMTVEEQDILAAVSLPHEAKTETIRRVLEEAYHRKLQQLPVTTVLRYRLPEDHKMHRLFAEWMECGPMTAPEALDRAVYLERKGFEVASAQVG